MIFDRLVFLFPFLLSMAISIGVGWRCFHLRKIKGAFAFSFVAFSQALWIFGYIIELLSTSLTGKIFWDNFQYIGTAIWPVAFLVFALQFTGQQEQIDRRWFLLYLIPVILMPALAFTDPLHGWMRSSPRLVINYPFDSLFYGFPAQMLVISVASYLIYLAGLVLLLVQFFRASALQRTQLGLIIAGGLVPVLGTVMTITVLANAPFRDISPLSSAISSLIIMIALVRYRLFEVTPVALDIIVDIMHDGVIVVDADGYVVEQNPSAQRILGTQNPYSIGITFNKLFANWPDVIAQLDFRKILETTQHEVAVEIDGVWKRVHLTFQPLVYNQGSLGVLIVLRDTSRHWEAEEALKRELEQRQKAEDKLRLLNETLERRVNERTAELSRANAVLAQELRSREKVEQALRQSEERYALAAQGANDGLWDRDLKTNHVFYSQRWKEMLGYTANEIGSSINEWLSRVHPDDTDRVRRELMLHLEGKLQDFRSEHRLIHKDGREIWVISRGLAVRGPEGMAYRMAGSCNDVTYHKMTEQQMLYNALHDALTGLPNRVLFLDRLGRAIERMRRHASSRYAVLYLDFDHFKSINDSLGHAMGDRLLQAARAAPDRLRALCRYPGAAGR